MEMRLIDADKLRREADHCRETTDAFQELIDQQPDFCKVDPYNIRNQTMEDKIKILLGERECDLRAARGECCRMCDGCDLSRNHIAFISLCDWLIEMMRCGASWLQEQEAKRGSVGGFACFVCGNCGVAITEGDRYCRHCGRKVLWK